MTQPDTSDTPGIGAANSDKGCVCDPLFERVFEACPEGILVVNASGEMIRVNERAERMFGYTREEMLGQPIEILLPERYRESHGAFHRNNIAKLGVQPTNVSVETQGQRRDGTEFRAEFVLSPVIGAAEGSLVMAAVRDITERKRTGEALRDHEQRLQTIMDNTTTVIYLKDTDGRYIQINRQFEKSFGVSKEQTIGRFTEEILPPEIAARSRADDRKVMQSRSAMMFEHDLPQKDGLHTYIVMKFPLLDASGVLYAVGGVATDITERKRAEAEKEKLLSILEATPDFVAMSDASGNATYVNRGGRRLAGLADDEDLSAKRVADFHPQWGTDLIFNEARPAAIRDGVWEGENALVNRAGRIIPISQVILAQKAPDGTVVQFATIARDITERKRAENELREREQLLESILDNSTAVIYLKDRDGRFLRVNRHFEALFGIKREQVIGKTDYDMFPTDTADRWRANDEKVLETGTPREFEEVAPQSDGLHTYISIKFPIYGSSGIPFAVGGISTDITERKKTEAALLLELTNVLVSNLEAGKLFAAIAASIRQVVAHDFASLALHDPESGNLRIHRLTHPAGKEPGSNEFLLPIHQSPAGWVFTLQEPVVMNRLDTSLFPPQVMQRAELLQRWIGLGVKSVCWLPLLHGGSALGVLLVASLEENAFPAEKVRLLIQVANQVAVALDNALAFRQISGAMDRLAQAKLYLEDELKTEYNFEEIIGESAALKRVLKEVETVAETDANVLILGETGTGKELIARAIHNLSSRREHTFVKLNCAAVPSGLLESELFGHEKGAFTGAIARRIGRLEVAHGGTLLLDEIGDIPLELQPKLLRALQEKEFERLGSTRTIPVDVRLLAATNRDLAQMVKEGRFRRDLFYRLSVFPVTLPPLRERSQDIPLLVHYFLQKHAQRTGKPIKTIPREVMEALVQWHWPGNVREMENLIERAVILSKGSELRVPLSELHAVGDAPAPSGGSTLESVEREHILQVLRETNGVIGGPQGAASKLGLKRTTLNFRMRKLGITRDDI